jgi:hypothetical protein
MTNAILTRFAEITAQAYIDEYPEHTAIDPQWLRQTWEVDAANEKWFTCTWEPYQAAALAYFSRETTGCGACGCRPCVGENCAATHLASTLTVRP